MAKDVSGSVTHPSKSVSIVHIRELDEPFLITRHMAVSLCDAVLRHELEPDHLEQIGFTIVGSDHFEWEEDDLIGRIFHDWACPQINFTLTLDNVARFRRWLSNEEPYPQRPPGAASEGLSDLICVTEKRKTRYPKLSAMIDRLKYRVRPK